jgi:signal transduction histidine kinase
MEFRRAVSLLFLVGSVPVASGLVGFAVARGRDGTALAIGLVLTAMAALGARRVTATLDALSARERRLEEVNRTLQRTNADLETFAYMASHDLS